MLFSFAVRAVYVESCSMFTRGGSTASFKEALGRHLRQTQRLRTDVRLHPDRADSPRIAGQYITGLMNELLTVAKPVTGFLPLYWTRIIILQFDMNYTRPSSRPPVTIFYCGKT